jgi:cardiolipin synthase A/B
MNFANWTLLVLHILLGSVAAGHALLFKRDSKAALGWIAVCLLFPLLGSFLYYLLGINRIRTRARRLHDLFSLRFDDASENLPDQLQAGTSDLGVVPELWEIVKISGAVSRLPIVGGNAFELLHDGEQVYPAMLESIDQARTSLFLSTYIFKTDKTGKQFIEALIRAHRRGIDVRVIIDGVGEWYAFPRAGTLLRRGGVPTARFLPPSLLPPSVHVNLRNHRKIMVADGKTGFIGGMNIGDHHFAQNQANPKRVQDIHFRLTGPVVAQIENAFYSDWSFCTGACVPPLATPALTAGKTLCRTIMDGPNEQHHGKLSSILFGAVSNARRRISVMTPYFLPSRELIAALQNAALRGVEVNILLPAKNNLPYVQWATSKMLWELLERGARVFYQPPPFVHSKLFIVDDHYAQVGSANIDPRSLRLNFELALEIYDDTVAETLVPYFQDRLARSRETSLKEVDARSLSIRARDALVWLFSPYL